MRVTPSNRIAALPSTCGIEQAKIGAVNRFRDSASERIFEGRLAPRLPAESSEYCQVEATSGRVGR